jgi:hypothetical protein
VQQLQFLSAKRLSLVLRERPVSLAFSLADYLSSQTSSMRLHERGRLLHHRALSALVIDGNAAARPDACPALHLRSRGSPKPSLNTAHSDPISRSSTHNYKIPRALTASATRCTTVKSP